MLNKHKQIIVSVQNVKEVTTVNSLGIIALTRCSIPEYLDIKEEEDEKEESKEMKDLFFVIYLLTKLRKTNRR